jgi:hypothetical protein
VRLAVPRRVYTNVGDVIRSVPRAPEKLRGVRVVRQAPVLRLTETPFAAVSRSRLQFPPP